MRPLWARWRQRGTQTRLSTRDLEASRIASDNRLGEISCCIVSMHMCIIFMNRLSVAPRRHLLMQYFSERRVITFPHPCCRPGAGRRRPPLAGYRGDPDHLDCSVFRRPRPFPRGPRRLIRAIETSLGQGSEAHG